MALEFREMIFEDIGSRGTGRYMWATVGIRFIDPAIDHHPKVEIDTVLVKRRDATVGELEEEARAYAIEVLRSALHLLGDNTLQSLELMQEEREAKEASRWSSQNSTEPSQ